MRDLIIADTGPIVGLVNERDQWNEWSIKNSANLSIPYLTCEAVITEACFVLQDLADGEQKVLEFLNRGVLKIAFSLSAEATAVKTLMNKYKSVPMSLADACLVRMSEMAENSAVFTVDSDFLIYRKNGRKKIPLISPY